MVIHDYFPAQKLTAQFILSIGCNANCFMCDKRIVNKKSNHTYNNLIKLLRFLDPITVSRIKLLGGEPLLDKKGLLTFLKACHAKGFYCLFPTNGSLFTEDYFDKLVLAGLRELTISLDSYRAEEHDNIRGTPGMFKRIIKILIYIRNHFPNFRLNLNFLVLPQNINSLNGTISLAETLGINTFNVLYPENFGKNFEKIQLTPLTKKKIESTKSLNSSSKMTIAWNPCNVTEDSFCSYQPNKIIIFENGDIKFCDPDPFKRKYKLDRPLREILRNPEIKKFLENNAHGDARVTILSHHKR